MTVDVTILDGGAAVDAVMLGGLSTLDGLSVRGGAGWENLHLSPLRHPPGEARNLHTSEEGDGVDFELAAFELEFDEPAALLPDSRMGRLLRAMFWFVWVWDRGVVFSRLQRARV
jgi:hypothetical protein